MSDVLAEETSTGRTIACWIMTVASGVVFLTYGRVLIMIRPVVMWLASDGSEGVMQLWLITAAVASGVVGFGLAIGGALARSGRVGVWLCAVGLLVQTPGVVWVWLTL
ncbi:hypothetical protein Afil01_02760 [Actinorhabdospora filicis]|uniref:Uncharacterized protein n=1 Tax=Actinorhabdospora filicis TaxID=1785913 RepID=A0A9W6W6E0_9ACTN|nr:hypothetical protein [Actinorhabdospora filicis]GLZ75469.1 hypothetical protein Afil01_02760 [Actinorhabdospora filicis]